MASLDLTGLRPLDATGLQPLAPSGASASARLDVGGLKPLDLTGLKPVDEPMTFTGAMGRGVDVAQGMGFGALEAVGEYAGIEPVRRVGQEGRERNLVEAEQYGQRSKVADVRSFGDFGQWAKETIGEQIPIMAPSIGGSVAGGLAGAPFGPAGITIGALLGAVVPSFIMGTGEVQGQIKEKDPKAQAPEWAFAGGAAIAALDSLIPAKAGTALTRLFGREAAEDIAKRALTKPVKDHFVKRTAKGAVSGMAIEGLTEAVQEAIGEFAAAQGTNQPIDWEGLPGQMLEAGAAGALIGGGIGGATSMPSPRQPAQGIPAGAVPAEDVIGAESIEPLMLPPPSTYGGPTYGDGFTMQEPGQAPPPMSDELTRPNTRPALEALVNDPRPLEEIKAEREAASRQALVEDEIRETFAGAYMDASPGESIFDMAVGNIQAEIDAGQLTAPNGAPWAEVLKEVKRRKAERPDATINAAGDLVARVGTKNAPVKLEGPGDVLLGSEQTAQPTPAQAEAGNYKKRHTQWQGLDIAIETEAGQERTGIGRDNVPWSVTMPAPYGYINRTEGKDGDQLDIYLGPEPQAPNVFVVDQIDADTQAFDEHKALIGFPDPQSAIAAYEAAFSDGRARDRMGGVMQMSVDEFKAWVKNGNTKKAIDYKEPVHAGLTRDQFAKLNEIIKNRKQSLAPKMVAKAIGSDASTVRTVLGRLVARGHGDLRLTKSGITRKPTRGPLSLFQFIASLGGIQDQGGELRSMDLHKRLIPGFGPLVRPTGRKLDAIREAAAEAGYFPNFGTNEEAIERTTVADLLDFIGEEASGRKVYSEADQGDVAELEARRVAEENAEALARAEADVRSASEGLANVTDEEVAEAVDMVLKHGADPADAIGDIIERNAFAAEAERVESEPQEGPDDAIPFDTGAASPDSQESAQGRREPTEPPFGGEERDPPPRDESIERGEDQSPVEEESGVAEHKTVDDFLAFIEREIAAGRFNADLAPTRSLEEFREAAKKRGWTLAPYGKGRALWSPDRKHVIFDGVAVEGNHVQVQWGEPGEDVTLPGETASATPPKPEKKPKASKKKDVPTYDLDGAQSKVRAGDADEIVTVTLARTGPWDFNDRWPAPDPKTLEALDNEGRSPLGSSPTVVNVVALLDEGLINIIAALAEVRGIDRRLDDIKAGKAKLPKKQTVEQATRQLRKDREQSAREVTDTAASYEDVFGRAAAHAMIVEARKRLVSEEGSVQEHVEERDERFESRPESSDELDDAQEQYVKHYAGVLGIEVKGKTREELVAALRAKGAVGRQGGDIIAIPRSREDAAARLENSGYGANSVAPLALFEKFKAALVANPNKLEPTWGDVLDDARSTRWKLKAGESGTMDIGAYADTVYIVGGSWGVAGSDARGGGMGSTYSKKHAETFMKQFVKDNPVGAAKPATEKTEAGEQTVLPGTGHIGQGEQAQRKANEALKPKVAQKPADIGLFGDESQQTDLVDMARAPKKADDLSSIFDDAVNDQFKDEAPRRPRPAAAATGKVAITKYRVFDAKGTVRVENMIDRDDAEQQVRRFPGGKIEEYQGAILASEAAKLRTPGAAAKSAVKNVGMGLTDVAKGLDALFKPKGRLGSGPTFDEQTYAQAKPFFKAGVAHFAEAGRDVAEMVRELVRYLAETAKMDRATIEAMKPYVLRYVEDVRSGEETLDAPSSGNDLESDRGDRGPDDGLGETDVSPAAGGSRQGDGARGGAGRQGDRPVGRRRVSKSYAPAVGENGNLELPETKPEPESVLPRGPDSERSGLTGEEGLPLERPGEREALQSAKAQTDLIARRKAQAAAESIPVKVSDKANIAETLPMLFPEQQDDVLKTEQRFAKPDGHGMLLTNGTGTGKTYSGLGVVKRFAKRGKDNILIVAPSQGILIDWQRSARDLGLEVSILESTQDKGKGIVLTTYANLGQNRHLADRDWDLVVPDEVHKLSSDKDGTTTEALRTFRALTLHPDGLMDRAQRRFRKEWDAYMRLADVPEKNRPPGHDEKMQAAHQAFTAKAAPAIEEWRKLPRPKALMMSATPFSYHFSLDYAEGYLFDFPEVKDKGGYNNPSDRSQFYIQNFGYSMRYGKLTKPDADVNSEIMERQFHEKLKSEGSLAGRALEVDKDYERKFVVVDDAIGNRIDQALEFLSTADNGRFRPVYETVNKRFDYLSRMRLLEAIKARHAVPYIKESLALGRKIVVFHDYNEGGGFNPFDLTYGPDEESSQYVDGKTVKHKLRDLYEEFKTRVPGIADLRFADFNAPITELSKAFPKALIYNGTVSKKNRDLAKAKFNDDDADFDVIVVQSAAGEFGISLHDTTGKKQRVLLNLGMPIRPTSAIQQEGRTYRVGQQSDAIFRYMNTGTNWERWTFAGKIAERAGTAENLALGNLARAMRLAFIDAFENADINRPEKGEGKGGKVADRASNEAISEFERAKTHYFAQGKNKKRRDHREGIDYFATPEPIGLKMVEWANVKTGEKILEPSAGHGAIARYFPEDTHRTIVEPSTDLASRAALVSPGARAIVDRFENLNIVNKYHAIVMNPPFGSGGRTAIDHIEKAVQHLANGGRIVALIPTGPAADAKFEKFMESDAAKGIYLAANIQLPTVTFERAGTSVRARIVVLEKQTDAEVAHKIQQQDRDYSDVETIKALFDRIEHSEIKPRQEPKTKETITDTGTSKITIDGTELELSQVSDTFRATISNRIDIGAFKRVMAAGRAHNGGYLKSVRTLVFNSAEDRAAFLDRLANPPKEEPAAPTGAKFDLGETTHAKTGERLYVATIAERVEREAYVAINATAKKHGGYYSTYRGRGAIPGFQFKSEEARKAFLDEMDSDSPQFARRQAFYEAGPGINRDMVSGGSFIPQTQPEIIRKMIADPSVSDAEINAEIKKWRDRRVRIGRKQARHDPAMWKIAGRPFIAAPLTDRFADHAEKVLPLLRKELDRIGLPHVALRVADQIEAWLNGTFFTADGVFFRGAITLALDADSKFSNLHHEALHALRKSGVFTDSEWGVLTRASNERWRKQFNIDESYTGAPEWALIEEGIAHAYAAWVKGDLKVDGRIARFFKRIQQFLEALGNALRGAGFKTAESIFEEIYAGEIGGRLAPRYAVRSSDGDMFQSEIVETVDGPKEQLVIPGAERSFKQLTDLRSKAPLKGTKPQKDAGPLFDDDSKDQGTLFSIAPKENSPQFRRWFKNSKVVDGNGKPLVVYHGTMGGGITEFNLATHFGTKKAANDRLNEIWEWDSAARPMGMPDPENEASNIIPVYLRIENPLRLKDLGVWSNETMADAMEATGKFAAEDIENIRNDQEDWINVLDGLGYDGIVYENMQEDRGSTSWIALRPEQVKSAIGNRGTFDPNDSNIMFALRQEPHTAVQRQRVQQGWLARGQFIDRAIRLPFDWFGGTTYDGQWKPGLALYNTAANIITGAKFSPEGRFSFMNPILETARAGLIDRHGLREDYVTRERQRSLDERAVQMQGVEILKTLKDHSVGPEEAKVLQAILNGEQVRDTDMVGLAEPIRAAIDQLGQEAVNLGLVSRESFERNRGIYLHRVYKKYESEQNGVQRMVSNIMGSRRKKIIGDQFRGRGMFQEVTAERLMRDVPGWFEAGRGAPQKGEKFILLDEMPERPSMIEGRREPKPLRRIYWPAEKAIPDRYREFTNQGTWEVRETKPGKLVIWRDFTKEERTKMGEIVDARYTIGKTFMLMAHDLAVGKFYQDIAYNEDWASKTEPEGKWVDADEWRAQRQRLAKRGEIQWVKVPETAIPDSGGKKRWGAIAGMWVREEIWRDLNELDIMMRPGTWRTLLTQWKLNKALALDTAIPTPSGWTTMGEIKVGDQVFDEKGQVCTVLEVKDVQHGRPCFEVAFSDGTKIVADDEHWWFTISTLDRRNGREGGVRTTKEIRETLTQSRRGDSKHSIPVAAPLDLPEAELPIPPYALGAWLGDGFSYFSSMCAGRRDAEEIIEHLRGCGIKCAPPRVNKSGVWLFTLQNGQSKRKDSVNARLRDLGLLQNKHIPQAYLRGSREQRLELLRGLMDTDGWIDTNGACGFSTSIPALRDGALELLRSLGYKPTVSSVIARLRGKDRKRSWRIHFKANTAQEPVFKLSRKMERITVSPARRSRSSVRYITSVEPVPSVPVRCIAVSSDSHLYLAGDGMIPTHNTARSPVVHMNNVLSNFVLMDMVDVRWQDFAAGIRSYLSGDENYREAFENGAFGADMMTQEIRDNVLRPVLEEIMRDNTFQNPGRLGTIGQMSKFTELLWSKARNLDQKMVDLYRLEDEIFRMATYMRRRELGDTPKEAATVAREQFIDYDIRAPGINMLRQSVLPFLSYTYRAVPLVARAIATRPWKVAKYFLLAGLVNALAYELTGGDEDEERRSLRDEEQGYTWIGAYRMIRMPFSSQGNPVFLDVRRWIPAGDIFDTQGHDIPAWMNLGGPLMIGAELFLNKSAFTGQEIFNTKTDDFWDRSSKRVDFLYKSFMPSAAWIPGSWYWEKIGNAVKGATDRQGRPYDIGLALSSSFGIKLKPQDVKDALGWKAFEFRQIERELQSEARRLAGRRERNLISQAEYERAMSRIMEKVQHLGEKAKETLK